MLNKNRDCELCKHSNVDNDDLPCEKCEDNSEFELYEYKMEKKIMAEDSCVCCGDYVVEGHQVCSNCEVGVMKDYNKLHKESKKVRRFFNLYNLYIGGCVVLMTGGLVKIIEEFTPSFLGGCIKLLLYIPMAFAIGWIIDKE